MALAPDLFRPDFRLFSKSVVRVVSAKLQPMNSINNTLNGLASSLLLNVGLTSVAEKFDPMRKQIGNSLQAMTSVQSCENCVLVCNFTPEAGQ